MKVYEAWVDGSTAIRNPGLAGSACILQLDDNDYRAMCQHIGFATNNVAELTAVSLLLGWLLKYPEYKCDKLLIHTDSEYSLGVCSKQKRASANRELVLFIHDLISSMKSQRGTEVEFQWCRAHSTNELNNVVDQLAKHATNFVGCHEVHNGVKCYTKNEFMELRKQLKGAI